MAEQKLPYIQWDIIKDLSIIIAILILFFCIDKLLFFILFMLSYSSFFPDIKIDTKDLDFFVPAFFFILALAISLCWQSKDLYFNLGIIFCCCVVGCCENCAARPFSALG